MIASSPELFDAVLHVTVLWAVLLLFFMFYASKMEADAFNSQFRNLIHAQLAGNKSLQTVMTMNKSSQLLNTSTVRALRQKWSRPSAVVQTNNSWLFRFAFTILVGLIAILIVIARQGGQCTLIPVGSIVRTNLAVFACVAVVEFIFFTNVISRYNPAPPSTIVNSAIQAAQN